MAATQVMDYIHGTSKTTNHQEESKMIGQLGGTLTVSDTGASIKIPEGAITGEPIKVAASLHWDRWSSPQWNMDYHPPITDDDFVIGPTIHCKPDGFQFLKPVQIAIPHSAEDVNAMHISVWTRSYISKFVSENFIFDI